MFGPGWFTVGEMAPSSWVASSSPGEPNRSAQTDSRFVIPFKCAYWTGGSVGLLVGCVNEDHRSLRGDGATWRTVWLVFKTILFIHNYLNLKKKTEKLVLWLHVVCWSVDINIYIYPLYLLNVKKNHSKSTIMHNDSLLVLLKILTFYWRYLKKTVEPWNP